MPGELPFMYICNLNIICWNYSSLLLLLRLKKMLSFTNYSSDIKWVAKADQVCQINNWFDLFHTFCHWRIYSLRMRQKHTQKKWNKEPLKSYHSIQCCLNNCFNLFHTICHWRICPLKMRQKNTKKNETLKPSLYVVSYLC